MEDRDLILFRQRYNMPPGDPRLDDLTAEDIAFDLELGYALREDAERQQCEECGGWTYRDYCPYCVGSPALHVFDRLVEREQRGEAVDWQAYRDKVWGEVDREREREKAAVKRAD